MLRKLPNRLSNYCCVDYVRVVNHLRHLGKFQALKVLEADRRESFDEELKIHLICRMLFLNPAGWKPPRSGVPFPNVGTGAMAKFPLFPLAISKGIPFVLIKGYELDGRGESAAKCLELCHDFPVETRDLAENASQDYESAARALIKSDDFKWLYIPQGAWSSMSKEILNQAKAREAEPITGAGGRN